MNKEYFKLKTSYASYYVEIWHQYPNIDKVYVGGKKKCVSFSIYLEDKESPNLDGFGYDESCNKEGDHVKGVGSIHLLKVSMLFIISHYKLSNDTRFQFKDTSFIECNAYKLALPIYYTVFYGKTWYESKFDAVPLFMSKDDLKEQRNQLMIFLKTKPHINEFFSGSERLKAIISKSYDESESIQDCLRRLKELDCSIFKNWLPALVSRFIPLLLGTEWTIQCNTDIEIKTTRLLQRPPQLFVMTGGDMSVMSMSFLPHEV